jgi:hypothetical protein
MKALLLASAVAAGLAIAPAALAQSTPAAPTPICTDRPTKANATCTVPAGDWQVETDIVNWTHSDVGGVKTDVLLAPNPTLKYGLSDKADIELSLAPYEEIRTSTGGVTTRASGVGDLYVRLKWSLLSNSSASVSIIPWIKAPTASHSLGNGKVEEGVALPVSFSLPDKVSLTLGPEIDGLENAALNGQHANLVNVVNLSRPFTDKLTLAAELWNDQNYDPLGTVSQTSADVAAAYAVTSTLQFDLGANFGLNRATPKTQLYLGVSKRF